MIDLEELSLYDQDFVLGPANAQERALATQFDAYFLLPVQLILGLTSTDPSCAQALKAASDALKLVESRGLVGQARTKSRSAMQFVTDAIDSMWRTRALAGCIVREKGNFTLVNSNEGEEVWLAFGPWPQPSSKDAAQAEQRALALDMGGAAVAPAREELLQGIPHVGADDVSLTGHSAQRMVEGAIELGLFCWEDATWWWPDRFAPRDAVAAADGTAPLEVRYPPLPMWRAR